MLNDSFLDFLNLGKLSSQSFDTISNPDSSSPFSQVVKNLDSTSPEPVPPFTVPRAPEPIRRTFPGDDNGKDSSFLRKRQHSAAFSFRKLICFFSY